jgi:hypothetical protein
VLKALADLGVPLVTTNYDGLMEQVTGRPAVTWREGALVEQVVRGNKNAMLHLHGHWEDPPSVVLGIRSYEQVLGSVHAEAMRKALAATRVLVFLGFGAGLGDPTCLPLPGPLACRCVWLLTGIPWRTNWKYRERGYHHLFSDAGAIVANLLAVAAAAGWGARVLLGFVDQEVAALLDIGEPEEYRLALVTVAAPTVAEPTGSPPLGAISPRTRPLSRSPRGYAWSPPSSAQVNSPAPRRSAPGATRPADSGPSLRPGRFRWGDASQARAATDTIETVILRRGSTRRFARHPIPRGALHWAMAATTRPVPAISSHRRRRCWSTSWPCTRWRG